MNWNPQNRTIEHNAPFDVNDNKACVQTNWLDGTISFYYWPNGVPKASEGPADVAKWKLKSLKNQS